MRSFIGTVLAAAKNQLAMEDPMRWLIQVVVPSDPPQMLRITNAEKNIVRGQNSLGEDIVFYSFPVAHDEFRENQKGDLNDFTINVCNVTLELMEVLETYHGLRDQPVVIRLVPQSDPFAGIEVDGTVLNCVVNDRVAIFKVGAVNLTKKNFPKNRYIAETCQAPRYGGPECGYVIPSGATGIVGGGLPTCDRTEFGSNGCRVHGDDEVARGLPRKHPERYGGYPGIKLGVSL